MHINEVYTFSTNRLSCEFLTIWPVLIMRRLSHKKTSNSSFTQSRVDPTLYGLSKINVRKRHCEKPFYIFHTTIGVNRVGHCCRDLAEMNVTLGKTTARSSQLSKEALNNELKRGEDLWGDGLKMCEKDFFKHYGGDDCYCYYIGKYTSLILVITQMALSFPINDRYISRKEKDPLFLLTARPLSTTGSLVSLWQRPQKAVPKVHTACVLARELRGPTHCWLSRAVLMTGVLSVWRNKIDLANCPKAVDAFLWFSLGSVTERKGGLPLSSFSKIMKHLG